MPWPVSSSGEKIISILPCVIFGFSVKNLMAAIISAMPALSSAPRRVVPSVVMIVSFSFAACAKALSSAGSSEILQFKLMIEPS